MNDFIVKITKKDTDEFVDVAFVRAQTDKGVAKKLKNAFKGCSFDIRNTEHLDNIFCFRIK